MTIFQRLKFLLTEVDCTVTYGAWRRVKNCHMAIASPEEADCRSEEGSWQKAEGEKNFNRLDRDMDQGQKVPHE